MARETIFQSQQTMPPADNSPDVVRTATCYAEMRDNLRPALPFMPTEDKAVKSAPRPRFGHGY